jgi:hypothetical protein
LSLFPGTTSFDKKRDKASLERAGLTTLPNMALLASIVVAGNEEKEQRAVPA